jgi:signal transduction histidine kinase/ligand-binding sensor domain-containing protein
MQACLCAGTKQMQNAPRWTPALALAFLVPCSDNALGNAAGIVREARVDPKVVHIEVLDGTDLRFSRLTRAQGVSQTRVSTIVQDDAGFIWFATQYGLNRYDGYTFRKFTHVDGDPHSVTESYIRTLFKGRSGNLWIASHPRAFDRYDPTTESFVHYRLDVPTSPDLFDAPRHISEDSDGMLWVATTLGLYRVDPATGHTTTFRHRRDDPASLSSDDVKSSGVDRSGTLWVATGEGVDAFDRSAGRVTMHVPLREPREQMSIFEDRSGVLWIIHASGDGLAVLDRQSGVLTQYSFAQHGTTPDKLTGVSSIIEDSDGQVWIGTESDGLLRLDRSRLRATRYRNDPLNPESLAENRTTALLQDHEGNIWVGLGATEPNYFTPRSGSFTPLPFDLSDSDNLGEKLVNVLYEDRQGILWVGTTGALIRYEKATHRYTRLPLPGPANGSDVLSVVEDRLGALWVGTSGQGLAKLDLASGDARLSKLYRHASDDPSSLSNDTVTHLLVDHAGTLWATTLDGLSRYDPVTDRFRSFRLKTQSGSTVYVSLMEDSNHTLWISGVAGVLHFDPSREEFLEFKDGLAALGYSVLAASNGEIWAATQNGLYRFDPSAHTSRKYTDRDGLPSNAISCLLEDAHGDIWLSTTEGLSRYLIRTDRFWNYSVQDGLPGRDFTGWSACFRNPQGVLYFGGFAGAVEFDPEALVESPFTPPVVLTQFELAGVPVQLGPGSPLTQAIGYTQQVRLSSNQRSFALEFAALSFRSPSTNRYRYRLEGLDTDWQEVGSYRRVASYTTLPPGSYTFRLQGATNRGPWSKPGVTLRITIEPPWWATWEFRTLTAVLGLAVVFGIYGYRVRQLAKTLQIRFDERIGERTRIARELHDTLLQSFHGLLLQFQTAYKLLPSRPAEAKQTLESAIDSAFGAITEGRDAVQGLRASTIAGSDLATAIKTLGDELTAKGNEQNSVLLRVDVAGTPQTLRPLVRDEIYRIAGESLRNAFRYAGATRIEVDLYYDERQLRLRVRDDGKGIDPQFLREGGQAGHYGIHGMRERAKLMGGSLDVWTAPDSGTEIELSIPASHAYARPPPVQRPWLVRKLFRARAPIES